MQPPSPQVDTEFVQFLQALPAHWEALMRERGALTYAGNIPTPEALLRAIFLSCGPDQSLREVAGTRTLRAERITDQAVWKRLHRCTPFLLALLKQLLPLAELPALPEHLRFLACDGTPLACPGATSTDDRLHLVIHLGNLSFQEVHISETKTGESLKNYRLHTGEVMVAERGYCSYSGMLDSVCERGAEVIVRWNPPLPLYAPQEKSRAIDLGAALKRQKPGTMGSLPVVVQEAETSQKKEKRARCGSLPVYRMTAQEATEARKRVSSTHPKQPRQLSEKTRLLRQFV
jgi:hypothetical protein